MRINFSDGTYIEFSDDKIEEVKRALNFHDYLERYFGNNESIIDEEEIESYIDEEEIEPYIDEEEGIYIDADGNIIDLEDIDEEEYNDNEIWMYEDDDNNAYIGDPDIDIDDDLLRLSDEEIKNLINNAFFDPDSYLYIDSIQTNCIFKFYNNNTPIQHFN